MANDAHVIVDPRPHRQHQRGPEEVHPAGEEIDAEAELELCRRAQIDVVLDTDERYPRPLRDLPDPPGVLFVRGTLAPSDAMAVAIVSSRHATH
jgi:DNA processing protein